MRGVAAARLALSKGAWTLVGLALVGATVSGCGSVNPPALAAPPPVGTTVGPWTRLPDPPLTPRHGALAVWTGDEVVVIGGSTAPPCPGNALCVRREGPVDGDAWLWTAPGQR